MRRDTLGILTHIITIPYHHGPQDARMLQSEENPMSDLIRISLSIDQRLLDALEKMLETSRYTNRSEFIRDMIRERLVQQEWKSNREVVGTITLVFDHHQRLLSKKLTELQHRHHDLILATTHVHLDHDICLEAIIVKGRARNIREITDLLRQQKGVLHATVSLSSTGKKLH